MTLAQILAIAIFVAMFIAILVGKVHRFIPALVGGALVIIVIFFGILHSPATAYHVLNLEQLGQLKFWILGHERIESQGVNWQSIIFIGGMMTMVGGMGAAGLFRWLCLYTAKLANYNVVRILISFTLLAGFLSMFIDSITVLLFLSVVTIELGRLLKFDPVPLIIAEIFAANTGGAATMSGDPPNIIIGTYNGFTFTDFITNTGPVAWVGILIGLGLFYLFFRKTLAKPFSPDASSTPLQKYPEPKEAITNPQLFRINGAIFIAIVILLVTHAQTGLSVASIGLIAAAITLLGARKEAIHIIKSIDWRTLLFFIGLFVCVAGLEETGVLQVLAQYIGQVSGGNLWVAMTIILWVSALTSAVVDNVPFAAAMCPVLSELSRLPGLSLPALAWTLALGTDVGGNATPIGASANVVATAIADREGYHIGWGRFCKYAFPAMIIVVATSWLLLVIRYG
jgi:Na+/H+ antiporter NhaD/arsenite permease-like protein